QRLRRDVVEFLVGELVRAALFVAEAAARPRPRHPERAGRGLGDEDAVRLPYIARVDPLDDEAPGVRPLPDLDVAHGGFRAYAVAAPHDLVEAPLRPGVERLHPGESEADGAVVAGVEEGGGRHHGAVRA